MKIYIISAVLSAILTLLLCLLFLPSLKKLKAGQTILKYVEEHKNKNGTPTMGGLFFVIAVIAIFGMMGGYCGRVAGICTVFGSAYMIIGFLDDFLKVKFQKNEGLKPYQKIIFQVLVGLIAGIFAYKNNLTSYFLPFTDKSFEMGVLVIPATAFIFIAATNAVNLTDGLDGLASSTSIGYIIPFILLINAQSAVGASYFSSTEYDALKLLGATLCGALIGFLWLNSYRAKIFMGDTGSLAIGGFLASMTVFSGNALYLPVFGIMFVVSALSVIIQVLHYKRTKRRVFLMAPFHHHLQHKGISESKISYIYMTATFIAGLLSILNYL